MSSSSLGSLIFISPSVRTPSRSLGSAPLAAALDHVVRIAARGIHPAAVSQAAEAAERGDLEDHRPALGLDHVDACEIEVEERLRALRDLQNLRARLVRLVMPPRVD